MKLLTNEQQKSYKNVKTDYLCKEKFEDKHAKYKNYEDAAYSICNLKYSIPTKLAIVFHNGFNYDHHFIIKELAEEFEKQFTCLGQNIESYITFSVPIEN